MDSSFFGFCFQGILLALDTFFERFHLSFGSFTITVSLLFHFIPKRSLVILHLVDLVFLLVTHITHLISVVAKISQEIKWASWISHGHGAWTRTSTGTTVAVFSKNKFSSRKNY